MFLCRVKCDGNKVTTTVYKNSGCTGKGSASSLPVKKCVADTEGECNHDASTDVAGHSLGSSDH